MVAVKILNGAAYQIIFKPISFQIMAKFFNGMQFVMQLFCQEHTCLINITSLASHANWLACQDYEP